MTYLYGGPMPDWLMARASLTPDKPALVVCDPASGIGAEERLTFAELDRRATAAARRLAGLGISAGDRVAARLNSGVAAVVMTHAVGRVGAVLVPLNTRLSPAELEWQIADARVRLIVYEQADPAANATNATNAPPKHGGTGEQREQREQREQHDASVPAVPAVFAVPPQCKMLSVEEFGELAELGALAESESEAGTPAREHIDLAAVHTIVYTSGTTGRPKGAMLTYGNHWWSAMGSMLNLGLRDDDCWLAPLPLFHVGGLSILMRSVIYGIPALVHTSFDPGAVNRAIDEDGVTIVSVVTAMLRHLLDARGGRPYPPSLRHVLLGGGPAPLPLLKECLRLGVPIIQTYGLTETASQAVTLPPADALRKLGSAGKPLLPTELRIVRDGRSVPPGSEGEIVLRGPTVTPGYADRPEETAQALHDGWLHTGDIGRLDRDGYLYVLDRRDDLIISGGENVYPAEVEATLLAHPALSDAGVTGQDDARWGRVPVAFVVLREDAQAQPAEAEIMAFCRRRLARYKVPARVYIVDALPRNAAGKLMRQRLRPPSA